MGRRQETQERQIEQHFRMRHFSHFFKIRISNVAAHRGIDDYPVLHDEVQRDCIAKDQHNALNKTESKIARILNTKKKKYRFIYTTLIQIKEKI